MDLQSLKDYLVARGQEASTWRGLILVATGSGVAIKPELHAVIVAVGVMAAGAIGAAFPDAKKDPRP
jgi:hypothetical protein